MVRGGTEQTDGACCEAEEMVRVRVPDHDIGSNLWDQAGEYQTRVCTRLWTSWG